MLQCVAVGVALCVAMRVAVCVGVCCSRHITMRHSRIDSPQSTSMIYRHPRVCVEVCCSVWQHVLQSVLQCVLECVAVATSQYAISERTIHNRLYIHADRDAPPGPRGTFAYRKVDGKVLGSRFKLCAYACIDYLAHMTQMCIWVGYD